MTLANKLRLPHHDSFPEFCRFRLTAPCLAACLPYMGQEVENEDEESARKELLEMCVNTELIKTLEHIVGAHETLGKISLDKKYVCTIKMLIQKARGES